LVAPFFERAILYGLDGDRSSDREDKTIEYFLFFLFLFLFFLSVFVFLFCFFFLFFFFLCEVF